MQRKILYSLVIAGMCSCGRGELIDNPRKATISVQADAVDHFQFSVAVNGETLSEALITPEREPPGTSTTIYQAGGSAHIVIKQLPAGNLLLDTLWQLNRAENWFTIFQAASGQAPAVVLPPAGEQSPGKNQTKISMIYTDTMLPDPVWFRIYNSYGNRPDELLDSVLLRRNEFSAFVTLQENSPYKVFDLKDPATGKTVFNGAYDITRTLYTVNIMKIYKGSSAYPTITRIY